MCPQRLVTAKAGFVTVMPVRLGIVSSLARGGDFILGEHGDIRGMGGHEPKLDSLTGCPGPAMFRPRLRCHRCGFNANDRTYLELSGSDLHEWRQRLLRCVYAATVPRASSMLGVSLILSKNKNLSHPCFNTRLGLNDHPDDFDLQLAFLPGPGCQDLAIEASLEIIYPLIEASKKHEQAVKHTLGF